MSDQSARKVRASIARTALGVTLTAAVFSVASGALAEERLSPAFDSIFYYRIGGARVFNSTPRLEVETLNLSINASLTGLECGRFDPMVTIEHTFNRVKDGAEGALVQLEAAASAAIAALPGYILQKIDPSLYDLFTNSLFRAEQAFSLATKSCEAMQREIRAGNDPFEEFITASVGDVWKGSVGLPGADIQEVARIAADDSVQEHGFNWTGGERAGGAGMQVAWLVADTAKAGYNMILGRDVNDASPPPDPEDAPPLVQTFGSPSDIQDWIKTVLGDVFVGICDGCDKGNQPGLGLRPKIEEKKDIIADRLQDLYDGSLDPTLDNLVKASAPDVIVTRQVIETLQQMSPYDASIYLSKMTDDVALSVVVNEALMVQQVLRTGLRESNIASYDEVNERTEEAIAQIDEEIDSIMREHEIKKNLVGSTLQEALIHGRNEQSLSRNVPGMTPRDHNPIENGVVPD